MKNCDQVAPLLSAYSDRELSTTQALLVRQHLFECEACAAEIKTLEGIRGLILEMPAAPEPRLSFDQLVAATRPRTGRRDPARGPEPARGRRRADRGRPHRADRRE